MKNIFTIAAMLFSGALTSCQGNEGPAYDPTVVVPHVEKKDSLAPVATTVPAADTGKTISINSAAAQPVTAGLNPAHGQPGHRCDIAVGAPLNSKPATNTTTTSAPVVTTTSAPVKTAPGMNPPHGQPGHRCDIAVGAPLNSKPAAANPAPSVSPAIQQTAPAEAAKPAEQKTVTIGAPATAEPAAPAGEKGGK